MKLSPEKVAMSRQYNSHTCRLCQAAVPGNRATSLFSPGGLQRQWASRITELLGVSVRQDDSRSQHMCRKCTRRIEALERAMEDLRDFRKQAQESHESLALAKTRREPQEYIFPVINMPDGLPLFLLQAKFSSVQHC